MSLQMLLEYLERKDGDKKHQKEIKNWIRYIHQGKTILVRKKHRNINDGWPMSYYQLIGQVERTIRREVVLDTGFYIIKHLDQTTKGYTLTHENELGVTEDIVIQDGEDYEITIINDEDLDVIHTLNNDYFYGGEDDNTIFRR